MLYVYALVLNWDNPQELPQGMAQQLVCFGVGTLKAIAEIDPFRQGLPQDDEGLLSAVILHDQIIQTLFQKTTLLPLRFGSQFQNEEQLLAYLQRHDRFYADQLEQFQNKAEVSLAFIPKEPPEISTLDSVSPDLKGRSYFLAKKQRLQSEQDRIALQQEQWIGLQKQIQAAYPHSVWPEETGGEILRSHVLVSFKRYSHLQKQSDRWQETFNQWQIQMSNPLPPYHFVQFPLES